MYPLRIVQVIFSFCECCCHFLSIMPFNSSFQSNKFCGMNEAHKIVFHPSKGQDAQDQRSDRMKRRSILSGPSTSSAGSSTSQTPSAHLVYHDVCILCNKSINVAMLEKYPGKLPVFYVLMNSLKGLSFFSKLNSFERKSYMWL